jgi:hypothetical protein
MESLPPASVLLRAAQVSMEHDKPIYLDYYVESFKKECCIGVKGDGTKHLIKSAEEYTSPIESAFKCDSCYIIATENSLYIVSAGIDIKKIQSSTSS